MPAVFINCATILIGSLIGTFFSKKISKKITDAIQMACGAVSFVLGIQMAFEYKNVVYLALSLILGGIIGTATDIDGKILKFGNWLGKVFNQTDKSQQDDLQTIQNNDIQESSNQKNFAYAFLNSSCLFCVGAMAIIGSFKAGIEKDYSTILLKSILDGFVSIGYAAAMGIGTAFSIITVFIYQGALTLLSVFLKPYVTQQMLSELTGSGGTLIIFIGLNLMNIKKIKTANYLPAVLFSILFVLGETFIKKII